MTEYWDILTAFCCTGYKFG